MELWKWIIIWAVAVAVVAADMGLRFDYWVGAVGMVIIYAALVWIIIIDALASVPSATVREVLLSKPRRPLW